MTRRVSHRCAPLLVRWCVIGVGGVLAHSVFAESRSPSTAEFLYQMAEEHRQAGRIDDAIHELRKLLLVEPQNEQARRELAILEALKRGETRQAEAPQTTASAGPEQESGMGRVMRGRGAAPSSSVHNNWPRER